jgi:hypothetical protein
VVKEKLVEFYPELPEYREDVLMLHNSGMYLEKPKWVLTSFDKQDNGIPAYDFRAQHL